MKTWSPIILSRLQSRYSPDRTLAPTKAKLNSAHVVSVKTSKRLGFTRSAVFLQVRDSAGFRSLEVGQPPRLVTGYSR